jgi:hypothetical protein
VTSKSNQPNILDLARYTPYATITNAPFTSFLPRPLRIEQLSWQSLSLAFSRGQPWSSHAWHPSPPSGLSHGPSLPWLCGSDINCQSRDNCWILLWCTYVLNQCSLVLEGVTLAQVVEFVVEVLVDLATSTVLD